jgi:hypothetical protein
MSNSKKPATAIDPNNRNRETKSSTSAEKWGQGANLDKITLFSRFPACHEACVLNFPVPTTT